MNAEEFLSQISYTKFEIESNKDEESDYDGKSKDEFWDISEILHCKIEWLVQELTQSGMDENDLDEHLTTLGEVQTLLTFVDEEMLLNSKYNGKA